MNRFQRVGALRRTLTALFAVAAVVGAASAQAQTWDYKSYKMVNGQYDKDFNMGAVSLEERDGKGFFRMIAGSVDACFRGDVPAVVTRTDALTTIELQLLTGCEPVRYVIRNDGSGGERQIRRREKWVSDGWDHGLVPKK